jgi:hypothetical protein
LLLVLLITSVLLDQAAHGDGTAAERGYVRGKAENLLVKLASRWQGAEFERRGKAALGSSDLSDEGGKGR